MAPTIEVVQGDITAQDTDAMVNAANTSLLGGGGVDGAIHHAGGPDIVAACEELRRTRYPRGLPTGEAVATTGGRLDARWVIHTVGPVYTGTGEDPRLLAACHINSMRVADELGCRSVAIPAISTGAYRYPVGEAAPVAVLAVMTAPTAVTLLRFVVFDRIALAAFERARRAAEAQSAPTEPHTNVPSDPGWTSTWVDVVIDGLGGFVDLFPDI